MLALIAGQGDLPAAVAQAQTMRPLICTMDGFAPNHLEADLSFRLEHLGSFLTTLKDRGVTDLCLCGAMARPPIDPTQIDVATMPLVPVMLQALQAGDDATLRVVMDIFEDHGFTVRAAHQLVPDILAPAGVLSAAQPDEVMSEDAERGAAVLAALAPFDVGQACVTGAGRILAIEGAGGTDHMLATLPEAARKARGVLVKRTKCGQDERADMPTIGPDTIASVSDAGLAGLVIEAGRVIILHRDETIARADEAGLVLWSRAGP